MSTTEQSQTGINRAIKKALTEAGRLGLLTGRHISREPSPTEEASNETPPSRFRSREANVLEAGGRRRRRLRRARRQCRVALERADRGAGPSGPVRGSASHSA